MSDEGPDSDPQDEEQDGSGERRRQPSGRRREPRFDPRTGEPVPDRRRKDREDD